MSAFDSLRAGLPGPPDPTLPPPRGRSLVAPLWHTVALIVFVFATVVWQAYKFHVLGPHPFLIARRLPMYIFMIGFEWSLLGFVWLFGLRLTRTPIRSIIGERWTRLADPIVDLGIAFLFWIGVAVLLVICRVVLGANPTAERALRSLVPQTPAETVVWILLALSAGICEEIVFRGYLQRQFFALTGNDAAAIALQSIVFGAAHAYQGFRGVITITLYGALFGILAILRRSLLPGMIQHFFQDSSVILLRFLPKH